MNRRFVWTAAAVLSAGAAAAAGASQGATSGWTQITHGHSGARSNLGLARGRDGTLHVFWAGPGRPPWKGILDTPISPSGAVGRPQTLISGWSVVHPPTAVTAPDGSIHVIVSGQKTGTMNDPYNGLNELVGPGSWKLGAKAFGNASVTEASNSDPRSAVLKNGQLITVWQTGLTELFQPGTDPGTPPQTVTPLGSSPIVAVDQATGEAIAADGRVSNGFGEFRRVYPSVAAPEPFPGNVHLDAPQLAARLGGGVYTAYTPDGKRVWLVRYHGRQMSVPFPKGIQVATAGLAPGPEGRLWVYYGNGEKTYVTRTNKTVSRFEPTQTLSSPPKLAAYFRLEGEGSAGPLDLFVDVTIDGAQKDGTYGRHVNAIFGIAVAKAPIRSHGKVTGVRVTVRVLDAGDGIAGASVGGLPVGRKTTDARGAIVFTVAASKHGTFHLTAKKPGYANAAGTLTL